MLNTKPKVALLVGGTSPERQVSKMSGKGILQALRTLQYPTIVINPAYGLHQPKEEEQFFLEKDFTDISNGNYIDAINSTMFDDVDVVFSAMHGKWAEDGTIQSLLELRGLKYTGSKVLASALAMDKDMSKVIFRQTGVQTADWFTLKERSFEPVLSDFLTAMRPGAMLINTARGTVVDEVAPAEAIQSKGLRAGLDVYEKEPSGAAGEFHPALADLAAVHGTHHIGASTEQAQVAIAHEVIRIVQEFQTTGGVPNCVNRLAKSSATHILSVRHQNRPGVLAHIFGFSPMRC